VNQYTLPEARKGSLVYEIDGPCTIENKETKQMEVLKKGEKCLMCVKLNPDKSYEWVLFCRRGGH